MAHRFVALRKDGRKTYLHDAAGRKVREVIWGDYLTVKRALDDGRLEIDWAARSPDKRRTLYIAAEDTVERRPLEIVFVDVGQGDGAVLISPETGKDERIIVIDAGKEGNMRAFLNARFKSYRGFNFHAAVVTHPDQRSLSRLPGAVQRPQDRLQDGLSQRSGRTRRHRHLGQARRRTGSRSGKRRVVRDRAGGRQG
ncbi:MAG: hypothetical protein Q8Q80_09450 [Methyloversatilis sp.]|uniref:hypothetical protein n=1 Tax=Methyloversatilis sp. TaxID=2569862 RepID=UPI002733D53F|nr:hypothetical protein [Methyloversatilis sp.]MDP3872878.1 hypothetical protein [Methyloversatilis sp.]